MRREIRSWRLHRRSDTSLSGLARLVDPAVRGWVNYYGRFHRSRLYRSLQRINDYLVRWAMRKYKRLRGRRTRAAQWLVSVYRREPALFAHWRLGLQP